MEMKHSAFFKSAAQLTLGGLVAKAIGAAYRVPLVRLLGGYGMGLYQMAYPLFCVLLTFSSAGIPSAFSRLIARETAAGEEDGSTVKAALRLFAAAGIAGTALMCLFAPYMCGLQGDGNLLRCYFLLAPSVFFVALIAVLRGYFQGKNDMAPTAVSEILEQVFKAGAGIYLAYRYRADPAVAAAATLFAVTMSEVFALVYLFLRYGRERHARRLRARRTTGSEIFAAALPVMISAALLPLSQTADSVIVVRLLSGYSERAVSLYGLFSGGALALIDLPATLCHGFAAAAVPAVSAASLEEGRERALRALLVTLLFSAPCAALLFAFARPAVLLLFGNAETELLVKMVRLMSVSAAFLAGTQTLAACLTGMGRAKFAAFSMFCGVAVKFALQTALVSDPRFGILGAAISANACYFIAFFLDLVYTVKKKEIRPRRPFMRRSAAGKETT